MSHSSPSDHDPPPPPKPRKPTEHPPGFYKVPRRFDLATVFVVTFAYAALLGVMNGVDAPLEVTGGVFLALTVVGIIQMIVSPQMARFAAIATGWIGFAAMSASFDSLGAMACFTLVFGGLIGYCAGTVVAGVFLVSDYLRKAARRLFQPD